MIFLLIGILLMPPGVREIEIDDERVEYKIPNGYGIDNIRVSVPKGMEADAIERVQDIYDILHTKEYVFFYEGAELHIKAGNFVKAVEESQRWIRILDISL